MFRLTIRLHVNHLVTCLIIEILAKVIVERWM
jgi:hypothetical protein